MLEGCNCTLVLSFSWRDSTNVLAVETMGRWDLFLAADGTPAAEDWLDVHRRDASGERDDVEAEGTEAGWSSANFVGCYGVRDGKWELCSFFSLTSLGSKRSQIKGVIGGFEKFFKAQRKLVCTSHIGRIWVSPRFQAAENWNFFYEYHVNDLIFRDERAEQYATDFVLTFNFCRARHKNIALRRDPLLDNLTAGEAAWLRWKNCQCVEGLRCRESLIRLDLVRRTVLGVWIGFREKQLKKWYRSCFSLISLVAPIFAALTT